MPHGGWCPAGRLAETGRIASRYQLSETPTANYIERTEWNARDSDATLIFTIAPQLTGGSKLAQAFCIKHGKPCLHLYPELDAVRLVREFLKKYPIKVLNVAGSRASKEPDIGRFVTFVLDSVFAIDRRDIGCDIDVNN